MRDAQRSRLPLLAIGTLAVVAGLGIGRFTTAGSESAPRSSDRATSLAASPSPQDQIARLESTVATDPDDATSWRLLGEAHTQRAARTQDPASIDAALEAFARATALRPDDPMVLVGKGALALTLHHFDRAEELGSEAARRLPANADALGVLVDAQVELGRYEDAAATLQQMLDVRPGLPALARTSYLRELEGDLTGAIAAMRQARVAGQSSAFDVAFVDTLLGDLHRKSGDLAAAGAAYRQALDGAADLTTAQVGLAWTEAAAGDRRRAIALLQGVVDEAPAPSALLLLHDLQRAAGDAEAEDTAELVRAVAALQEASGQVVDLEMALFEANEGSDPDRAVELARRAHAARPDNIFVNDAMAWALFRAGDPVAAAPYADAALRLGSTEPLLRYHAAEILLANGDRDSAAAHLTVALRDRWFSFQLRDRALELARELGIDLKGAT